MAKEHAAETEYVKYGKVLELCELVQPRLVDKEGRLLLDLLPDQLYHLQNTFYVSGNIRDLSPHVFEAGGIQDYVTAIELLLHSNQGRRLLVYNFKHLIVATCLVGLRMTSSLPASIAKSASELGFPELETEGNQSVDFLALARAGGDELLQTLLEESGGTFPPIFLTPDQALRIPSLVFMASRGYFPSLCSWSNMEERLKPPHKDSTTESNDMTANIFLSIAKKLQESASRSITITRFSSGQLVTGPSAILLLYYWAFALSPSPSACNNLGIILSTTAWSIAQPSDSQHRPFVVDIGKSYYEKGIERDPGHPHLLTNMGSLLKETGDLDGAIELSQFECMLI